MISLQIIFWLSVALVLYAYAGYPLVLLALSRMRSRTVQKGPIQPPVSFIITAHNEQSRIREKLDNTLQLAYPRDKLQIIVASDCSTDGTDAIVLSYAPHGFQLVRALRRNGKESAQKHALGAASGEILIFSDVATSLEPLAVRRLVENFADPSVGCVSSVDRVIGTNGGGIGEGAYVRYEMLLRSLESSVNSLVGLSGSCFAARRTACDPWREDLQSDFNTVLNSIRHGFRGVSDPQVVGYYRDLASDRQEFSRKVRTIVRGITVLMNNLPLLNPFRYGMFAWQLFSHKLCRWLVPLWLILAFVSNILLATADGLYAILLITQIAFYASGALVLFSIDLPRLSVLKIPAYFLSTNLAIAAAWVKYFRGERFAVWQPSAR
jgi:glycosyltransferase involved in cell wall biosynthesis